MSVNTKFMGYPDANISFQEGGQVVINTGSGDGNIVVSEDGASLGGSVRLGNKPMTPGEMPMPFPMDMFAGPISMPQSLFMPPFMDLLPMLVPVVVASGAIAALSAIAASEKD
jgi:hypothetical protein